MADTADNVSTAFRALPMEALIGEPFKAACTSNQLLANAMWDYVQKVAYEGGGSSGTGGSGSKKTRLLNFTLDQPITNATTGQLEHFPIDVNAPFIGLVPIPTLLIDTVNVDFTMTVKTTAQDTTTTKFGAEADGGFWGWKFHASLSVENERMRSSSQEATYTVHVGARQQPQTEGLSKLMDVMANCIVPMKSGGGAAR